MKNLKLRNKILIPVSILIILIVGGNILQFKGLHEITTQTDLISDDLMPRVELALNMNLDLSDYRRTEASYLVSSTDEQRTEALKRMEKAVTELESGMKEYEEMLRPDQDEQRGFFTTFVKVWEEYQKISEKVLLTDQQGDSQTANTLFLQARAQFDEASKAVEGIVAVNERNAGTAGEIVDKDARQNQIISISLVIVLSLTGIFLVVMLIRSVAKPIQGITDYMGILASGDLTKDVPDRDRKDEIGHMTAAIQTFKENMVRAKELEEEQRQADLTKLERQKKVEAAIKKFELTMSDIVKFVSSASTELQASAQSLSASAEETSKQSGAVAAASQQAAANVQTVASATEELSSSINEISSQVARSSQVASQAVTDAQTAGQSVSELVEAAHKIGEVTQIISAIAEQTNLLALNATIEAARAGDAGKGFAVVASEVKNLANESTKATEEISSQILHIQQISQTSAAAIDTICRIIREMDEISGTISAAIQEQTSATQEISRNVSEAYTGTSEVTQNIGSVSDAANSTGSASHQVLSAADELSRQSETLKEEFDIFIKELAAA